MTSVTQRSTAGDTRAPAANKTVLLLVGGLLVTMTNAIIFVLPPLLPVMEDQFGLTAIASTLWIYTALTLGGGVGFILLPRLADVRGDRNASVAGAVFLTVGAVIPAIGNSYATVLAGAVLMGFGAAAQLLPLGFLRRNLGENGIAIGVALLLVTTGTGIVVGMIGGGFVVENLSLRAFFVILTLLCALTVVACAVGIPNDTPADSTGKIGVLGAVWLVVWVGAVLLTLTQGLVWGNGALIPLLVGVVGGIWWVRAERTSSTAVFDVALLKAPLVTASCVCVLLFAAANAAFLLLLSTYVQITPSDLAESDAYGLGLSALETGYLMLPFAVTFLIGSVVVEGPVTRGKTVSVFVVGAGFTAAGLAWLAGAHTEQWHYLVGAAFMGLGCSIGYATGFTTVQLAAPEEKAGMAAGVPGVCMAIGFAFGTALISGVLSAEVIPVKGSDLEVATEPLYGQGYGFSIVFVALVLLTLAISRLRSARRDRVAVK